MFGGFRKIFTDGAVRCFLSAAAVDASRKSKSKKDKDKGKDKNKDKDEGGEFQSPIDICSKDAEPLEVAPLSFSGMWEPDLKLTMRFFENSVYIEPAPDSNKLMMKGGPMAGAYFLNNVHFHWGENDEEGSEHRIDTLKHAMEAHLVFYRCCYKELKDAFGKPNGVVILSVIFLSDNPEPLEDFNVIIDNLCGLGGCKVKLKENVLKLFEDAVQSGEYFTYEGSNTKPPYPEKVRWLVFKKCVCVHCSQVQQFRQLRNDKGDIVSKNWRPIQPLNDRVVYSACPA